MAVPPPRSCPFCEAPPSGAAFPFATEWNDRVFAYVKCSDCATTYVDPVPTDEEFAKMYAVESYHDEHYGEDVPGRHERSMDLLARMRDGRERLLDFGCGDGSFLLRAKDDGWLVAGIEHDARTAETLRSRTGLDVKTLDERLAGEERWDVIHLGDVLEHLPRPVETLERLQKLLRPRGVFFFEGPLQSNPSLVYGVATSIGNAKRVLGRMRPGQQAPTHLVMTTAKAQRRFFERRMGYRVHVFEQSENGWPYISTRSRLRKAIGQAAVALSRLPVVRNRLANRFASIVEP